MREYGVIGGIKTYQVQTAVLGTGAAGYNAACLLKKGGADDLVIITESRNAGTSRNTGSDKQTYYKLSLAGDDPDSVFSLASDLFAGRAVDGDIALCEAALSSAAFLRLADMGVPFPVNRYGEYIGYKTDHPQERRTSHCTLQLACIRNRRTCRNIFCFRLSRKSVRCNRNRI